MQKGRALREETSPRYSISARHEKPGQELYAMPAAAMALEIFQATAA